MAGQGTPILASDFNAIQSTIANVLGSGSGTQGYGQTVTSSQVSVGSVITASGWVALRNDLIAARQHQTGNNESGNLTVETTSRLVSEYDRSTYAAYAALVSSNSLVTPPSGQATLATLNTSTRGGWSGTVTQTLTLNFGSYNNARYFFNAGSNIQFTASLTGYSGSDNSTLLDNDWATLLSAMGTITMNYNSTTTSGSGSAAGSIGFYQLTTSPQLIFTKTASTYSGNQYQIYANVDGTNSIITFSIRFEDVSTGSNSGVFGVHAPVEGTLTSTTQTYYASGSNVSVSSYVPSVSNSGP
jgi:hypothetical protein